MYTIAMMKKTLMTLAMVIFDQCINNPIKNDLCKIIFYSNKPIYSIYKFIQLCLSLNGVVYPMISKQLSK